MNPRTKERTEKQFNRLLTQYRTVGKEVGEGGFSKVYAGVTQDGQYVAIKNLQLRRSGGGVDPTLLWDLRVLGAMSHENVITVKDVAFRVDPPSIMIYQPFMQLDAWKAAHGCLYRSVPRRHFKTKELHSLLRQLLCGVQYLHAHGVLHRDLKPSNVMLDIATGNLKIIDFGWSRFVNQPYTALLCEGLPGTPNYRAPEVMTRSETYGEGFDMWAVGVTVAELATGTVLVHIPRPPDEGGGGAVKRPRQDADPFYGCEPIVSSLIRLLGAPEHYPPPHHRWHGRFRELAASAEAPPYDSATAVNRLRTHCARIAPGSELCSACDDPYWLVAARVLAWDPQHRLSATEALTLLGDDGGDCMKPTPLSSLAYLQKGNRGK